MEDFIMDNYNMTNEEARRQLESGYAKAKEILNDSDKLEEFLQRLEKQLKVIPNFGEEPLSNLPIMISLVRSYVKKEYTDIPNNSIIFIVFALVYFVSPFDLINEILPVIGFLDSEKLIGNCFEFVKKDIEKYKKWNEKNGIVIND